MSRLKIGLASILGLAAALADRPVSAEVDQRILAAKLSATQKFVVSNMAELGTLTGAAPGDIVTVVAGESGEREVREIISLDAQGNVYDTIVIERNRTVEVTETESVQVGEGGVIALSYSPVNGVASILNWANALHTDVETGESSIFEVTQDEVTGNYVVSVELVNKIVKVQYVRHASLSVGTESSMHSA